jgi:mRNA interferase MazF
MKEVKRGEIYYADLTPVKGSEQGGVRPVLIIQNDIGNKYSPTTIVCVITAQKNKSKIPTHLELGKKFGLSLDSMALFEQIRTIDKNRLRRRVGKVTDPEILKKIDKAIATSFGLCL